MVGADDLHRTFELRLAPLRGAREIEEDVVLEVAAKFVGLILEAINRVLAGAGRREHVDLLAPARFLREFHIRPGPIRRMPTAIAHR